MGFKVIRDFISDKSESAVGVQSIKPRDFHQSYVGKDMDSPEYEYNGGKIKIRLNDDDGNIYYHLLVDDIEFSCELALDWGGSFAGCTSVDLRKEDWDKLTEGQDHPGLSKDGKWYSYMS